MQDDAGDGGESHAAEGDGAEADGSAADTQDEDSSRDAQVAGLREVDMVVNQGTDTGGGDHAVQQDAYAAQNCLRNGTAQGIELGAEGEQGHPQGAEADDGGRIQVGNSQNAGVLGVDGEGGTTEAAGEDGGNAAGEYRAVQAGLVGKVLADDGADRHNITDVLQTGNDGAGGDEGDGSPAELGQGKGGNADPGGLFQGGEIHQAEGDGDEIAADQRDDDGHNAGKALGEVIDTNRDKEGDDGDGPVGLGFLHANAGEGKAQYHDDGSNDDGREYAGYTVLTQDLEQQGKQQIKDCHAQNAALRVGDAHFANDGGNTGDDGEGAAQERGDHPLIDELIDDGADAGAEQGDGNIQTAEDGNQDNTAHGQGVLQAQDGLLTGGKVIGKVAIDTDDQFLFFFCHGIIPPQIYLVWLMVQLALWLQ